VLTDFQRSIAIAVSNITETEGFALAGGAALIVQGLVNRITRDLDFFSLESEAVNRVCPLIESALRSSGMDVRRMVDAPGFVRLEINQGDDTCDIDLGHDVRLLPAVSSPIGLTVAIEELAADKTLALFGRAAARDFVDVFFLSRTFGEERLCELAVQKDPGFDRRHFAEALAVLPRLTREAFQVDDVTYVAIRQWSTEWRSRLLARELQHGGPEASRGRSDDRGLEI
jgi:hypothetical protein